MADTQKLLTLLTLDNKQFLAGIQQSEIAVRGFSATGAQALKGFGMLFGGSLLAGAGALGLAIKNTADKFDDLSDKANNLGIGVEQLQALSAAAGEAGISSEGLTSILVRMQKTIGSAANGNKSAIESFERIGLSFQDLIGLAPDEQLEKISAALSNVKDQNLQVASASDILGKQGGKNLAFLTSNLKEVTDQARKMGEVLDEESIKSLGSLSDKFDQLGRSISASFGKMVANGTPAIDLLISGFTKFLSITNELDKSILNVAKNLGGMAREVIKGDGYNPNVKSQAEYAFNIAAMLATKITSGSFGAVSQFSRSKGPFISGLELTDKQIFDQNVDNLTKRFAILDTTSQRLGSAIDNARTQFENFSQRMEQVSSLLINRYDVNKGKPQLESEDFDNIARDLLERQMRGSLTTDYAKSKLRELQGITENNLDFNDKGELTEFSTANLKNDLKQLQDLLLGNKGKNEIAITVDAGPEFETKIKKISENSFTDMLINESTAVN